MSARSFFRAIFPRWVPFSQRPQTTGSRTLMERMISGRSNKPPPPHRQRIARIVRSLAREQEADAQRVAGRRLPFPAIAGQLEHRSVVITTVDLGKLTAADLVATIASPRAAAADDDDDDDESQLAVSHAPRSPCAATSHCCARGF